jgi:hypothetical protein
MMNKVVVRHHGERNADIKRRNFLKHRLRSGSTLKGGLRGLLDNWTVHYGIRKRDTDFNRICTVRSAGANGILPTRIAASDIRNEQLAAGVA